MIKLLKIFIKFLSFGKFYYKNKNEKKEVLIFDPAVASVLNYYFEDDKCYFFFSRKEKFEIIVFFVTIIKGGFKNFGKRYFFNFLKKFKPKYILSMWILNDYISQIKKEFPEIKILMIQSHRLGNYVNLIKDYPSDCFDHLFVFSEYEKINFKKIFYKSQIKVIGSVKYNHFSNTKQKKENKILYLSQYKLSGISIEEIVTLDILNIFCRKNDIRFDIQLRNAFIKKEYTNFLKKKNFLALEKYFLRDNSESVYKNSNNYKYIVTHSSTLVDEFLSNFRKLAVIDSFDDYDPGNYSKLNCGKNYRESLINPMFNETKPNIFWTKSLDKSKVNAVLNNLVFSSDDEYKEEIMKYSNKILYDEENKIFKKSLIDIGLPVLLDKKVDTKK